MEEDLHIARSTSDKNLVRRHDDADVMDRQQSMEYKQRTLEGVKIELANSGHDKDE